MRAPECVHAHHTVTKMTQNVTGGATELLARVDFQTRGRDPDARGVMPGGRGQHPLGLSGRRSS